MNKEPICHSHITDELPSDHPWAFWQVCCVDCGDLVHAGNNECMTTWFEWKDHAHCGRCFAETLLKSGVLEDA